ncbi:MAG: hypothetical protein H6876_11860 [Hyphomicrobiaceae bacterium]|nr:hypothetical protein [Hyphomicrobiaceae bacterium]
MSKVLIALGGVFIAAAQVSIAPASSDEMPSFLAAPYIGPLQAGLQAYAESSASAAAATSFPSFIDTRALRTLGHMLQSPLAVTVLDRELASRGAPNLTTTDFQATLHAARRDAGETRALADEIGRRAAELSDGLPAVPQSNELARLPASGEPSLAPIPPAETAARPAPLAPTSLVGASKAGANGEAAALIAVPGASSGQAGTSATERLETAALPREPLPGRMSLGTGAHMIGPDKGPFEGTAAAVAAPLALPPIGGATTAAHGAATRTAAITTSSEESSAVRLPAPRPSPTPLSETRASADESGSADRAASTPAKLRPARGLTPAAAARAARHRTNAADGATAAGQPAASQAVAATPPPAPPAAGGGGLFSWFKPVGKAVEVPRDLTALGWASN